ncbi:hypothetical protein D9M73_251980 [compost metagenome]
MQVAVETPCPGSRGQPGIAGAELPGIAAAGPQLGHRHLAAGHVQLSQGSTRLAEHGEHRRAGQRGVQGVLQHADAIVLLERLLIAQQRFQAQQREQVVEVIGAAGYPAQSIHARRQRKHTR